MVKVTNNAKGARGAYNAAGELVMIEPGQSADIDLPKGHKLYDGLSAGRAAAASDDDGPKALSAMNKAELLEAAEADGVTSFDKDGTDTAIGEGTNKEIAAAIQAKRAAAPTS